MTILTPPNPSNPPALPQIWASSWSLAILDRRERTVTHIRLATSDVSSPRRMIMCSMTPCLSLALICPRFVFFSTFFFLAAATTVSSVVSPSVLVNINISRERNSKTFSCKLNWIWWPGVKGQGLISAPPLSGIIEKQGVNTDKRLWSQVKVQDCFDLKS